MKNIDGHIKHKIIRLSNNQFAGLREKFAQADFLFGRGKNGKGVLNVH